MASSCCCWWWWWWNRSQWMDQDQGMPLLCSLDSSSRTHQNQSSKNDVLATMELLTAHVDLSTYSPISQICFGLNGDGEDANTDPFWINFVFVTLSSISHALGEPLASPIRNPFAFIKAHHRDYETNTTVTMRPTGSPFW